MSLSYLLLEKLDWPSFLKILASFSRTQPGKNSCLKLDPNLKKEEILKVWDDTLSIKTLLDLGYNPPVSDMESMDKLFMDINIGKILTIKDFCDLRSLAYNCKYLLKFCSDFEDKSYVLKRFKSVCYNFSPLISRIEKIIDIKNNDIRSDASAELVKIRNEKFALIRKIEFSLKAMFSNPETSKYLQDTFYTVRSDRYVLPFKLDANGRVPGSVYDTSDSGQTLFMEPASISPLNEKLLNIKVQERVEILRILKELSDYVYSEREELAVSYREIIDLDILCAKATLAFILNAGTVNISDFPGIDLIDASHPLLLLNDFIPQEEDETTNSKDQKDSTNNKKDEENSHNDQPLDITDLKYKVKPGIIPNSISLQQDQTTLIISGPNAGGKTATLKLIAFLHLMLKAGLLIPARSNSTMYLFNSIFIELGDLQSIVSNLSTFSAHIHGLKPILTSATSQDLVLLDELCSGTDPQTGSALGQAILEQLIDNKVISIVTTHFDKLKSMAVTNPAVRNGSMSFSLQENLPTYKLILDIPGQSYGIEIAEKIGLSPSVITRAHELKGSGGELNSILDQLLEEKEKLVKLEQKAEETLRSCREKEASIKKQQEKFQEEKNQILSDLRENFESEINKLKSDYQEKLKQLKAGMSKLSSSSSKEDLVSFTTALKELDTTSKQLKSNISAEIKEKPVGTKVSFEDLSIGDTVWVAHLKKQGEVLSLDNKEFILVKISNLNIQVNIKDIWLIKKASGIKGVNKQSNINLDNKNSKAGNKNSKPQNKGLELVLRTETNCLDIRGIRQDELIDKLALFLDRSYTHGETDLIIIHGHGTDVLKKATRQYLASSKEYKLSFRPGSSEEGGDGVTIVHLK